MPRSQSSKPRPMTYSYVTSYKLNATTTYQLNRSASESFLRVRACSQDHSSSLLSCRGTASPRHTTRNERSEPQELTTDLNVVGVENSRPNMLCPCCYQQIYPRTAWKNSTNRFYCSEFCADSETSAPIERSVRKEILDRQYLERLRRLLPLFHALKANQVNQPSVGALQ